MKLFLFYYHKVIVMNKKEQTQLPLVFRMIREGYEHLFSGNALNIISILSGEVQIESSHRHTSYHAGGLCVIPPLFCISVQY